MTELFYFLIGFYIVANRGWFMDVYRNRKAILQYAHIQVALLAVCVALMIFALRWFP